MPFVTSCFKHFTDKVINNDVDIMLETAFPGSEWVMSKNQHQTTSISTTVVYNHSMLYLQPSGYVSSCPNHWYVLWYVSGRYLLNGNTSATSYKEYWQKLKLEMKDITKLCRAVVCCKGWQRWVAPSAPRYPCLKCT